MIAVTNSSMIFSIFAVSLIGSIPDIVRSSKLCYVTVKEFVYDLFPPIPFCR